MASPLLLSGSRPLSLMRSGRGAQWIRLCLRTSLRATIPFAQVGVAVPWRYSVWRDERTLWALAQELGLPAVKGGRANTHTAIEDACACLKSVITIKDMLKALASNL